MKEKTSEKLQLEKKRYYRFRKLPFGIGFSAHYLWLSLLVKDGLYSLGFFSVEEKIWILTVSLLLNSNVRLPKSYR